LLAAARFGVSVEGCTLYTTLQPCFGCLKEIIQASVREVCYLKRWESRFVEQYAALAARLGEGNFRRVLIDERAAASAHRGMSRSAALLHRPSARPRFQKRGPTDDVPGGRSRGCDDAARW